jgi:hypothetical protein
VGRERERKRKSKEEEEREQRSVLPLFNEVGKSREDSERQGRRERVRARKVKGRLKGRGIGG